ncbi:hypothetical protein [Xanthomarina sp. F2636L]|uniref:hypothetical protein n=1 Tax=Xanthomarina sp. F2636L TaxID=2996018 RepID=UPI00225E560C|nr:hypothetical protein [Xanthomarina sp. F2636L]MCX7550882.1 hypothetical protein [Xanthomarina sp. F2636L]
MKLDIKNSNEYYINNKRPFIQNNINGSIIEVCFEFAYNMVFGDGHHRDHRSGGQYSRKKGELFANTFQGKIAEFVTYNELINLGFTELESPDTGVYGKGVWDDTDLVYKQKKINIKSAAFFSNLLLLEKKDWNTKGEYIPNIHNSSSEQYDYFLMVRIKPDIKNVLQKEKLFYSNEIDKNILKKIIFNESWFYDFGGVCSLATIKHIINKNYFLPQNSMLNGKIKMDADNFYIQCGDLRDFNFFTSILKKL